MRLKYYSGAQVMSIIEKLPDKEYLEMLNAFAKEPSADVVEVVRCKECKHRIIESNDDWCECTGCDINPDGFCEEGERKEDA